MCYVIELTDKYLSSNAPTVTVKRNEGVKMEYVKWTMTSDHDYLGLSHNKMWIDFKPFKFTSKFGDIMSQKITAVQTIRSPLNCTMYNADYISEQQCMANHFFARQEDCHQSTFHDIIMAFSAVDFGARLRKADTGSNYLKMLETDHQDLRLG